MRTREWLVLISFVWGVLGLGAAMKWGASYFTDAHHSEASHPFFRGEKMAIAHATVADLMWVKGMSVSKAQKIVAFLEQKPGAKMADLKQISGVKEKSLGNIAQYFF
jgi:DNA uptake protein ComE-like DNA-binding protein